MSKIHYVFNGDADGIFATHQLRLANPDFEENFVTGVKRDISLLKQLKDLESESIFVLDVAVEKNLEPLIELLDKGNQVTWFDHHKSPEIPEHENFFANIDTAKDVNTSFLVSSALEHEFVLWSVAGLFGDNLFEPAQELGEELELDSDQIDSLKELGQLFNYNGYGQSLSDLHFTPLELLESLKGFESPLDFLAQSPIPAKLREGLKADMAQAESAKQLATGVYLFPDEAWARRVVGDFANGLAQQNRNQAHAVLNQKAEGGYQVSVRAPKEGDYDAADFCSGFPTGGGRTAAAGINHLEADKLDDFLERFQKHFGQ